MTPVRPDGKSPKEAYAAAVERIEAVRRDSRQPTPALVGNGAPEPDSFTSPVSRERYCEIVETCECDTFGDRELPALTFEEGTDSDGIR